MQNIPDLFNTIVEGTADYLRKNNIQCMVLGISGGIDSTVCAAICREISKRYAIPLIGRSLPLLNKDSEKYIADNVGKAFCDEFKTVNFSPIYEAFRDCITDNEGLSLQTRLANGNIQCRMRMTYLYNVAGTRKGIVIDTDNLTEHFLGFFTKNGDDFDYSPIGRLWKTEVYELAQWLLRYYGANCDTPRREAVADSIAAIPTDGLGFSNSDLEQIGAATYDDVDDILQTTLLRIGVRDFEEAMAVLIPKYGEEAVYRVLKRCSNSHFKRQNPPIPFIFEMSDSKKFDIAGLPFQWRYDKMREKLDEYFANITNLA